MTANSLIIREGQPSDAEVIAEFQQKMALETEKKTLDPEIVLPAVNAVFKDKAKGFYVCAESDGRVVGSLMITFEWSDWRNSNLWWVQSVFVEPDFRGQGIFSRLYEHVIESAKANDVMFVRLYVETGNERAQKTYERLGMKKMPYYMYDVKL